MVVGVVGRDLERQRRNGALGLVRREAGLASSVGAERSERERGRGKAVGGRRAGSRGWRSKEEGKSEEKKKQ